MESAPACAKKAILVRAYSQAASDYGRAVEVLNARMGVLSKDEYKTKRAFAEKSRVRAEKARDELDRHIAEHGC
jgi:hypothetical protein